MNEPLRVRARISPHRPGLALEVALKDAVPVRHKKLPGTRDGESLRILECPLPDRGERVPVQIIHEDALAGLVGDVQAVFPGDDSGGTRDARDGLHVGAVQVEADHARIAPVGDPQVPPAVKSHVLGSEEGARRASGAAEGGDLLSAGAASGDPVRPVLGDVESPVIGLHHVVGAVETGESAAEDLQEAEVRIEVKDFVGAEGDEPESAVRPGPDARRPAEGIAPLQGAVQFSGNDPGCFSRQLRTEAAPEGEHIHPFPDHCAAPARIQDLLPRPQGLLFITGFPLGASKPDLGEWVRGLVADRFFEGDPRVVVETAVKCLDAGAKLFSGSYGVEI